MFIDTEYDTWNMDPLALEKPKILKGEFYLIVGDGTEDGLLEKYVNMPIRRT